MRKLFFIFIAIVIGFASFAQKSKKDLMIQRKQRINALIKKEEEGVISYHKQTAFGIKLNSDGYGGFFELGKRHKCIIYFTIWKQSTYYKAMSP